MVCYMKKGGVAVADGGTLLLALPFFSSLVIKFLGFRFLGDFLISEDGV